jgi:predicted phosphoribosyltransferase
MQISASTPVASASPAALPAPTGAPQGESAEQKFLDFMHMTPAQQMRAEILGQMGLTEAQVEAMSPKERAKLEEKIHQMVKQKVEQSVEKKTGVLVDVKA